MRGGVVYFVVLRDAGRVKIGRTKDLRKRLLGMQSDSPFPLSVLGTVPGGAAVEFYLHATFAAQRQHGEWFTLTPEIEAVAETAELPAPNAAAAELGTLRADGPMLHRFALVEQALAQGHDAPTIVARAAGCDVGHLAEALKLMQAFGFLRGSRGPSTEIKILAA